MKAVTVSSAGQSHLSGSAGAQAQHNHGESVRQALHQSVRSGDLEKTATLLKQRPDVVFMSDADGNTALHLALHRDVDMKLVQLLVHHGADPGVSNLEGDTCFHLAFALQPPAMAVNELLMKASTWRNIRDVQRTLDLLHAKGHSAVALIYDQANEPLPGYEEVCSKLESRKSSWTLECYALLNEAIGVGDVRTITRLLSMCNFSPIHEAMGGSVLHLALMSRKPASIAALIQHAAGNEKSMLEAADKQGKTPLLLAASLGMQDAMLELITAGADVYATDETGASLVHYMAAAGMRIVGELTAPGCFDPDYRALDGSTPMMWAARAGHLEVIKALRARDANINARDLLGKTPLMYAHEAGHGVGFALSLVARGANNKARDNNGRSVDDYQKENMMARAAAGKSVCTLL